MRHIAALSAIVMRSAASWTLRYDCQRWLVGIGALIAALLAATAMAAFVSSFAWPRSDLGDPNAMLSVGRVTDFKVGEPVYFSQARFWLVRQADDSFVAFSARNPYLGCTVPWRSDFHIQDPRDGVARAGWFRDPCHGSTYYLDGVKIFGPSPRDLGRYPVEVSGRPWPCTRHRTT